MSAVAEARKHPPATESRGREVATTDPVPPGHLWVAMVDRLRTHMQDRGELYRRLAR